MREEDPPDSLDPLDPAEVLNELRHAFRHGARAALLTHHAPRLVDLLTPPPADAAQPAATLPRRARETEKLIRIAIAELGGDDAAALSIMFGLTRHAANSSASARRRAAARRLGIQPDTFRRPNHEGVLMLDLAMRLCDLTFIRVARLSGLQACDLRC